MRKLGIIVVYFGRLPAYFYHFLACCGCNEQIKWFLFTDQDEPVNLGGNIHYNYLDINIFNNLASEKLGFPVQITDAYKLCDFKPTYGLIFEDFLKDYDYWGYCDADLVLGNLGKFLFDDIPIDYDIISTYDRFLSGPFCLYKNNQLTRTLFSTCPDYQSILQNHSHLAFDENIPRKKLERFSFKKLIYFMNFILKEIPSLKKYNYSFTELRYGFQWILKQNNIIWKYPGDMTEAVFAAVHNKTLNARFKLLLHSDRLYRRIQRNNWHIRWKSGILTDMVSGSEIFAFHYPESKKNQNFKIDIYDPVNKHFIISKSGIQNG